VLTERTPPSRNSSEGGVGGGVSTLFRNLYTLNLNNLNSRSEETPPPSRVSSEGGVGDGVSTEETPPSRVSSEGGVGGGMSTE
jgi:hypothetical protein